MLKTSGPAAQSFAVVSSWSWSSLLSSLSLSLSLSSLTSSSSSRLSAAGPLDEKLNHCLEVGLLLGADAIAAHLATRDAFEIQLVNQLVH